MDKIQTAEEVFHKCADEYEAKFMDFDLYNPTFDIFCTSIEKQNADVLEIACGPGNITRYLINKRPDFKILGIDFAQNMVNLAKKNIPSAEFQLMDCKNIRTLEKKFDAIMCGFCLPYLTKEEAVQLIKDGGNLLNPGGVFYISTMEDDYEKSTFKTSSSGFVIFMHYHRADYLTAALEENGFEIIQVTRQDFPEKDGTITTDLIIIARRNAAKTKAALKVVL